MFPAATARANPNLNCDACAKYAATAVAQNAENQSRKCNFAGRRWSGDFFPHFNWCMQIGPGPAGQETNIRLAALRDNCMMRVCRQEQKFVVIPLSCSTLGPFWVIGRHS